MREFIYYSNKGRTSGNFTDLMKAGRMDIVCHIVINSFFLSQKMRDDVKLHLLLNGPPDPPKHIEIQIETRKGIPETVKQVGSIYISKKDIGGLIQRVLYKYKKGKKIEPYKGIFIEKKSFVKVIDELKDKNVKPISIGPQVYFASHVVVILNNILDRNEI